MINVLIADNQVLTRTGIMTLLALDRDIHVIGCADGLSELEQLAKGHQVQIVMIDQHFDLGDINDLRWHFRPAQVIILSNNLQRVDFQRLKQMGVKSYIAKTCGHEELINAIYTTVETGEFICSGTRDLLAGMEQASAKTEAIAHLSNRETEIVHLIADGLANKDIAEKLFISVHTIRTHRKNIIRKLGFTFKNAAELVLLLSSLNDFI